MNKISDELIILSGITSMEMGEILKKSAERLGSIEDIFFMETHSIASLMANYIDTIFKDKYYDTKIEFVDSIVALVKILLKIKEDTRNMH